jgi:hypothetical protein
MMESSRRQHVFLLSAALALAAAWVGVWGAWIEHPSPALTRNAIDLAEWAPYLNEVRSGGIPHAPTLLRVSVSLLITALAVAAVRIKPVLLRWVLRLLALIPALWMLPPYPEILAPFALGYGPRLAAAGLAFLGVATTIIWDATSLRVQLVVTAVCAGLSAGLGIIGFGMMSGPFANHYATTLNLGWGIVLTMLALMVASGLAFFGFTRNAKQGA